MVIYLGDNVAVDMDIIAQDELKISEDAGTTDLCPFDCQCCF